jgi:hypothetical protein
MKTGYASIALIIFMVMAMTVITGATIITLVNSQAGSRQEQGMVAHNLAENGLEEGILRYLRDPVNYSGETLSTTYGNVQVQVIGNIAGTGSTITSTATYRKFIRKVQTQVNYPNTLTVTSWQEKF